MKSDRDMGAQKAERITVEEFDEMLEREATDIPGLPADFSRADIYHDHD